MVICCNACQLYCYCGYFFRNTQIYLWAVKMLKAQILATALWLTLVLMGFWVEFHFVWYEILRVVTNQSCSQPPLSLGLRDHVTPALKQLHWLPVEHRIKYKLRTVMHQIHTGRAVSRWIQSSTWADYIKHCTRTKFGERCFSHARPAAWNSLPDSIILTADTNRFKNLLNTHLFHLAFWHFVSAPGQSVSHSLQILICMCTNDIGIMCCTHWPVSHWWLCVACRLPPSLKYYCKILLQWSRRMPCCWMSLHTSFAVW